MLCSISRTASIDLRQLAYLLAEQSASGVSREGVTNAEIFRPCGLLAGFAAGTTLDEALEKSFGSTRQPLQAPVAVLFLFLDFASAKEVLTGRISMKWMFTRIFQV